MSAEWIEIDRLRADYDKLRVNHSELQHEIVGLLKLIADLGLVVSMDGRRLSRLEKHARKNEEVGS